MRYIFLVGVVLLSAGLVAGQEPSQVTSPSSIEESLEATPQLYPAAKEASDSPLLLDGSKTAAEAVGGEPSAGSGAVSNDVNIGQVSFLMDTGVQYESEGEYADAEKAYLRALDSAPGDLIIRFRLSTLYIQMKQYSKAADLLEKLLKDVPDNSVVCNNLAWVYATGGEMKNGKLALRYAREALLDNPTAPSVWNTLAEAYYVCGDYEAALRSSEVAAEQLGAQKPSETERAAFAAQHTKIERAIEADKRFRGIDKEP